MLKVRGLLPPFQLKGGECILLNSLFFPQKEGGLLCTTPPAARSTEKHLLQVQWSENNDVLNFQLALLSLFPRKEFQMFEQAAPQVHVKMSIVSTQVTAFKTKRKLPICKSNNAFLYLFCCNICHIYFFLLMCLLSTCAFLFNNIMCAILNMTWTLLNWFSLLFVKKMPCTYVQKWIFILPPAKRPIDVRQGRSEYVALVWLPKDHLVSAVEETHSLFAEYFNAYGRYSGFPMNVASG